jgi:hypothetical protein
VGKNLLAHQYNYYVLYLRRTLVLLQIGQQYLPDNLPFTIPKAISNVSNSLDLAIGCLPDEV